MTILYTNINSSVSLAHGNSPQFEVKCGIRRGCQISPFLFLIAKNLYIINCVNVKGIKIGDDILTINQVAND